MPRTLIRDTCPLAAEIMDGQHDENLRYIEEAVQARKKNRIPVGCRVRITAPKHPDLDGQEGVVFKRHSQRAAVGLGERDKTLGFYEREVNVPYEMLERTTP